ncbi:MAG: DUF3053 family protein [Enterobacteriaceae bacterium]
MLRSYRSWFFSCVIALTSVFLIAACGDKEAEQQKQFTDFLQNTVLRGGQQMPALSEDQRRKFGRFVDDYAILNNSSQQIQSAIATGMVPLLTLIEQIKVPEDYLRYNDNLQKAQATMALLAQQLQSDKVRTESEIAGLKQSEALKTVYTQVYQKIVSQPRNQLLPQMQQMNTLAQNIIQVGEFLKGQGEQVSYANGGIQLHSEQAVAQYNVLMESLKSAQQILPYIRQELSRQG